MPLRTNKLRSDFQPQICTLVDISLCSELRIRFLLSVIIRQNKEMSSSTYLTKNSACKSVLYGHLAT